ncbi:MAG: hypothetical protein H6622_17240 [Halobacteriovoraceae bacterium]|nr:hypothetical protein [Halobacteriovoraceae bacterium]
MKTVTTNRSIPIHINVYRINMIGLFPRINIAENPFCAFTATDMIHFKILPLKGQEWLLRALFPLARNQQEYGLPSYFLAMLRKINPSNSVKIFKIAFSRFLADNIKKRRFEELGTSPNLLNNTNLTRRPVCLESILVFPILKIQNHFYRRKNFSLSANLSCLSRQLSFLASAKKFLLLDKPNKENLSQLYPDKLLERKENMRLTIIDGGVEEQTLSQLYPKSETLSRKYIPQKDFIREIIQNQGINLENFKLHPIFPTLSKNEKNLFRYHLKQIEKETDGNTQVDPCESGIKKDNRAGLIAAITKIVPSKAKKKRTKVTKAVLTRESLKGLVFLGIEAIVLYLSHSFYFQFGFNKLLSWGSASVVEGSYTILSSSQSFGLKTLKWLVFIYSAFSVSYSSFINDPALKKRLDLSNDRIIRKQATIAQINKDLASARADKATIRQAEKGYIEYGKITKGLKNLEVPKRHNELTIKKLKDDLARAKAELDSLQEKSSVKKIFTWENFKNLETKTHSFIFLMLLLQIISSSFIGSICATLRAYINQKEKQRKKRISKGESYGHVPSYISVQ